MCTWSIGAGDLSVVFAFVAATSPRVPRPRLPEKTHRSVQDTHTREKIFSRRQRVGLAARRIPVVEELPTRGALIIGLMDPSGFV